MPHSSIRRFLVPILFVNIAMSLSSARAGAIDLQNSDFNTTQVSSNGFDFNLLAFSPVFSPAYYGFNNQVDTAPADPAFAAGSFLITGYLSPGGLVAQTFSVPNILQAFTLDNGFTGFSQIPPSGAFDGTVTSTSLTVLNSILVDATPTPEPTALLLAGAGLLAVFFSRKRK